MFPKTLTDYCHQLLEVGARQLDLPVGVVGCIQNDIYRIVAINRSLEAMKEGSVCPLKNTYCSDVYRTGRTIALTEAGGIEGIQSHPLYLEMPLVAYISAPIRHHEHIWGTVNFRSDQPRPHPEFTEEDIQLIEAYALLIHKKLLQLAPQFNSGDHDLPHAANH